MASDEAQRRRRDAAREKQRRKAERRARRAPVIPDQAAIDAADAAAWRADQARREADTYARLSPSDGKHRPRTPDPLLTGDARVTGTTAQVARRAHTVTRWEHDALEDRS